MKNILKPLLSTFARLALTLCFLAGVTFPGFAQTPNGAATPHAPQSRKDAYTAWPPRPLPSLPDQTANSAPADCANAPTNASSWGPWMSMIFMSFRNIDWDIYRTSDNICDSSPVQLTKRVGFDGYPSVRSNVSRIAFVSDAGGSDDIFTMATDGSDLQQLTFESSTDTYPAWSPDGRQIAFVSDRTGDPELYVMNADGSGVRLLTSLPGADVQPDWSPDGTRIVFVHILSDTSGMLYTVRPNGAWLAPLSSEMIWAGHPAWSPDGTQVAVEYDANNDGRIEIGAGSFANYLPDAAVPCNKTYGSTDDCALGSWVSIWSSSTRVIYASDVKYVTNNGTEYVASAQLVKIIPDSDYVTDLCNGKQINLYYAPFSTDAVRPVSRIEPLAEFVRSDQITLQINAADSGSSGLSHFWIEASTNLNGPWQVVYEMNLNGEQTYTNPVSWYGAANFPFPVTNRKPVYFRIHAADQAGNLEATHAQPDAHAWIYTTNALGKVTDQRDVPLAGVNLQSDSLLFPSTTGLDGAASAVLYMPGPTFVTFSKPGYPAQPLQTWQPQGELIPFRAVMTAEKNLLANGNFEAVNSSAQEPPFENWQNGGALPVDKMAGMSGAYAASLGGGCFSSECNIALDHAVAGWFDDAAQSASDSQGIVYIVSQGYNSGLTWLFRDQAGAWSAPVPVGTLTAMVSDLLVDSHDALYMAASNMDGIFLAHKPKDGSWAVDPLPFPAVSIEKMKLDSHDNLHLLYRSDASQLLYSRRSVDGIWTSPKVVVDDLPYTTPLFDMAVRDGSRVDIIWIDTRVNYTALYPSGITSPTEQIALDTFGIGPDSFGLGQDAADKPVVYLRFRQYTDVLGRDDQGHWTKEHLQDPPGTDYYIYMDQSVSIDRQGNFHIAGKYGSSGYQGDIKFFYEYIPSGGGEPEYYLLQPGGWVVFAAVTADQQGFPHFLLKTYSNNTSYLSYAQFDQPAENTSGWISQTVTIPSETYKPTISFMYQLNQPFVQGLSNIEALVTPQAGEPVSLGTWAERGDWQHAWADLSPWAGQTVTVALRLNQAAGEPYVQALFDEAFVGSWSTITITSMSPIPGHWITDWADTAYTFTLTGTNIRPEATLRLGDRVVPFTYNNGEVTFTVPPDLPAGIYTPQLSNPGGAPASAPGVIGLGVPVVLPVVNR